MFNTELKTKLIDLFQKNKLQNVNHEIHVGKQQQQHQCQSQLTFINPHKPLDEYIIRHQKYTNDIEVIVPLTHFQYKKIFKNNTNELIAYLNLHLLQQ